MNLLLLCDKEWVCRNILRCLDLVDRRIYVMATWPNSPIRYSRRIAGFVSQKFPLDGTTFEAAQANCLDFIARHRINLVIPCDLESLHFLNRLGPRLNTARIFPIPDCATVERLHNKWNFHRFLERHGLPSPRTVLLRCTADIEKISFPYPVVVKPLAEAASRGFEIFRCRDELIAWAGRDDLEFGLPMIAQEFIPGREIGINLLALNGRIVAWAMQSWENLDGERALDFLSNDDWLALAREIVSQSNFHGLANIDALVDKRDGGIRFIDFNPRFWETVAASMFQGTNFAELGIEIALRGNNAPHFTPATGRFLPNGVIARRILSGRTSIRDIRTYDYRAIRQTLADPLPTIISKFQRVLGRATPFTANIVEELNNGIETSGCLRKVANG
jgi:predicted ATP-grasp superfamily ATP-dependent carboligase